MDSIEVSFGEKISKLYAEKYRNAVIESIGDEVENISDLERHGNFGFYVDCSEDIADEMEDKILDCLPDDLTVSTRQTYF